MKIIDTKFSSYVYGNAAVDLLSTIEREIVIDDGKHIYITVQSDPTGEMYYVVSLKSSFGENIDMPKPLEIYSELSKTKKSKYHQIFVDLDKELEEKIRVKLDELDDTLKSGSHGMRCGAQFNSKGLNTYIEEAIFISKEDKYVYLQIYQNKDGITYSITDTSIFLRIELGYLYSTYYGDKPEVPFLLKTNDLDALGEYNYLKDDFVELKGVLDKMVEEMKNSGN